MIPNLDFVTSVNSDVNANTRYKTDAKLYNKTEFWEVADGVGDCEDYALCKRKIFIENGYGDACMLATCWVENGEYHAVLIVTTEQGDYVLDNRHPEPMMRQSLPYKWDKIQKGKTWHAIF